MRDDIHKTLKMSRACRKFLRLATREADQGPTTRQAALDALITEVKNGIGSGFLERLSNKFNEQGNLLNPLGAHQFAEFTKNCSAFEESVASHCSMQYDQGVRGAKVIKLALEGAISEVGKRIERGIVNHIQVECGYEVLSTINAVKESLRSAPIAELTNKILNRESLSIKRPKAVFDVDAPILILGI